MTTDAKQVPPALSAEEWQEADARRVRAFVQATDDLPPHLRPEAWGHQPQVALALANAALPDDSPYKITRADVEACRAAGPRTWHDPIHGEPPEVLARLAAKLEALLPPL
jgi:hypothetical protein